MTTDLQWQFDLVWALAEIGQLRLIRAARGNLG